MAIKSRSQSINRSQRQPTEPYQQVIQQRAKEDALAAAAVLKELAAAGENTYGFAGMVNSMEALANLQPVLSRQTQSSMHSARNTLKKQRAENMPSALVDAESLVKSQISSLLEQLKIEAVIPVRVAAGGTTDSEPCARFCRGRMDWSLDRNISSAAL